MRRRVNRAVFLAVLLVVFAAAAYSQADLIIVNANVRTLAKPAKAEAIAIRGSRIIAVGSNSAVRKLAAENTEVIDAGGRLVIPGFNDSHVHFLPLGNTFSTLRLSGMRIGAVLKKITSYTAVLSEGAWIVGSGLATISDENIGKIDAATPKHPLFIYLEGGKKALVNSVAAGDGKARIVESVELAKFRLTVPKDHSTNYKKLAETASNYAASLGITSIQEMSSDDRRDVYRELENAGRLKVRIYDCSELGGKGNADRKFDDSEMVRGGCRKGFWEGDEDRIPSLERDAAAADAAGLQVMIHAIGRVPNEVVLGIFERVSKTNGKRDRRFRIEHANGITDADRERFVKIPVIASFQPHLFRRSAGEQAAKFDDAGVRLAFGSDAAMTDMDPLLAIRDAVVGSGGKFTAEDAVRAYTIGSAYAEFQENVKGTIEAGKYADLVIISDDIFSIEPEKIADARVVLTMTAGRVVYRTK